MIVLMLIVSLGPGAASGQDTARALAATTSVARRADVVSADAIITALYDAQRWRTLVGRDRLLGFRAPEQPDPA
jgi:hypothetical protein